MAAQGQRARPQPLEEVARVAHAKREVLLRAYRHLLRREDLEDCYSQATLELLAYARRGGTFADASHLGNTPTGGTAGNRSQACSRRVATSPGNSP